LMGPCALFIPIISADTRSRAEGYFRLEWKLAVDRSHLMATDKAFLVPVAIDGVRESDARVPDKFREVQWMRLPAGETSPSWQKNYCLYEAESGDAIREAARRAGLPADIVIELSGELHPDPSAAA
jgi:hypothetical protein